MKRILILLAVALFAATCSHGQNHPSNLFATRIYKRDKPDSLTGQYHTLKNGLVLPVYVSSRGNYYVIVNYFAKRYKHYIKPESI